MLWLTRNLKRSSPINLLRKIDGSPDWNIIIWLIFIIYLIINILLSNSLLLGLYGLAKILELSLLGFYIARNLKTKKEFSIIALIFSISIIGESLLTIAQYIHQGSINGLLYFLGERRFAGSTPGIANASINGELILRPYATFPHPNVLAGYLLCGLVFIYSFFDGQNNLRRKLLKISALLLGSIALFLSLSRTAIILWIILSLSLLITRLKEQLIIKKPAMFISAVFIIIITSALLAFTPILPRLIDSSFTENAFIERADLLKSAWSIIQTHPLFGVGLYNFIPALSLIQKPLSLILYLQPVHNIFMLILAETGLIGFIFICLFLLKTYKNLLYRYHSFKWPLLLILSIIIILGQFDHYWLTLQQGQLLLVLFLGLSWAI